MSEFYWKKTLNVPKALFCDRSYRSLSTTAKLLYSLCLERVQFSDMNGWIDERGRSYILYPKSQIMRDLGCGRCRVDKALAELKDQGDMIYVTCPCNGKANRIYVYDITEEIAKRMNGEDTEDMGKKTQKRQEKEKRCRVKADTAGKKEQLSLMVECGYADEDGVLNVAMIQDDAADFGMALALSVISNYNREGIDRIRDQINFYAGIGDWKRTQVVLETVAEASGMEKSEITPILICYGKGRKIFVEEAVANMNSICGEYDKKEV